MRRDSKDDKYIYEVLKVEAPIPPLFALNPEPER